MERHRLLRKAVLIIAMLLTILATSMPIFAATDSFEEEIDAYEALIRQAAENSDTETKAKFNALADKLFSDEMKHRFMDLNNEEYKTIKGGYAAIEEVIEEIYGDYSWWEILFGGVDVNAKVLSQEWKSQFRTDAEQFGIEYGNIFNNKGDDRDEIKNASIKVNILTWSRDTDSKGKPIQNNERGVMLKLLTSMEGFHNFSTIICGISVAITIAFGCATLIQMSEDRNLSESALTREFAKILLGVWFIFNYKYFTLLVIRIGTLITQELLTDDFTSNRGQIVYRMMCRSIYELVDEKGNIFDSLTATSAGFYNIGSGLGNVLSQGMTFVSSFIGGGFIQLASSMTIYVIAIEIAVRYLFTPIAIADLYSEKFRSTGFMWLKKLLACSMQGAIIFAIIFSSDALKKAISSADGITITAINLTMLGMFAKSRQIANDVIGVH